jgi:hypothetical protein
MDHIVWFSGAVITVFLKITLRETEMGESLQLDSICTECILTLQSLDYTALQYQIGCDA